LADLQRTVYPHKWSPVSCWSIAGQRKLAGQRPTFYRWATVGDVVRRLTDQGLVHEETQFVLDSLHDRKPMQLPKGGSYMVAWFQVEHESRRRLCYHTCEHDILKTYWTDVNAPLAQVVHGTRAWNGQLTLEVRRLQLKVANSRR